VKVFDGKFLSTEQNDIHDLCQEEEPCHSSSLQPISARLNYSRDSPQGPEKEDILPDLTHPETLQHQQLRVNATVTKPWQRVLASRIVEASKFATQKCVYELQQS